MLHQTSTAAATLSDDAIQLDRAALAADIDQAERLWNDPEIGDLAAEEFLTVVQRAQERFHLLMTYPAIGMDVEGAAEVL